MIALMVPQESWVAKWQRIREIFIICKKKLQQCLPHSLDNSG